MDDINFDVIEGSFYRSDRLLFTAQSFIVKFVFDLKQIYVLVDSDKLSSDRNIFAYDEHGQLVWQVAEMYKLHDRNYFTSIYMDNDVLFAYNKNGVEVTIDKQSGNYIKTDLVK